MVLLRPRDLPWYKEILAVAVLAAFAACGSLGVSLLYLKRQADSRRLTEARLCQVQKGERLLLGAVGVRSAFRDAVGQAAADVITNELLLDLNRDLSLCK